MAGTWKLPAFGFQGSPPALRLNGRTCLDLVTVWRTIQSQSAMRDRNKRLWTLTNVFCCGRSGYPQWCRRESAFFWGAFHWEGNTDVDPGVRSSEGDGPIRLPSVPTERTMGRRLCWLRAFDRTLAEVGKGAV